jgi:hypothetical protein
LWSLQDDSHRCPRFPPWRLLRFAGSILVIRLQEPNAGGERRAKRASVLAVRSSAWLDAGRGPGSASARTCSPHRACSQPAGHTTCQGPPLYDHRRREVPTCQAPRHASTPTGWPHLLGLLSGETECPWGRLHHRRARSPGTIRQPARRLGAPWALARLVCPGGARGPRDAAWAAGCAQRTAGPTGLPPGQSGQHTGARSGRHTALGGRRLGSRARCRAGVRRGPQAMPTRGSGQKRGTGTRTLINWIIAHAASCRCSS